MSFTQFDASTFLAYRAIDAETLPLELPQMVALPGAKAAIDHDRLQAHHARGHDQDTIVARVNERWERHNAARIAEHRRWVLGPYAGAIEEMREAQMRAQAEELRRRAVFEEIMAEREGD